MLYKTDDINPIISIPAIVIAKAYDSDGKYYILIKMKDDSTLEWIFESETIRDRELQIIFDLQIVISSLDSN